MCTVGATTVSVTPSGKVTLLPAQACTVWLVAVLPVPMLCTVTWAVSEQPMDEVTMTWYTPAHRPLTEAVVRPRAA